MVYLSICRAVWSFMEDCYLCKKRRVCRGVDRLLFCSERESCAKHAVSRLYRFFIALLLSFISLSCLR